MAAKPVSSGPIDDIRAVFADAGCNGWLHARVIGADSSLSVGGTEPVVPASVYKALLLVAALRAIDEGRLDPLQRITVTPRQHTPGPTGIAALCDPVEITMRDLLRIMMAVSDNAAASVVIEHVGVSAIHDVSVFLGLSGTHVVGGDAEVQRRIMVETGTRTVAEAFAALATDDIPRPIRAYDPAYVGATTPADMTSLLSAIWLDTAASAEQCAFARSVLAGQVFRQRIASGFGSGVAIAGKTGTLGALRNEIAVLTYPQELPVAVAIFTHAVRNDSVLPVVDAAIGRAAAIAVQALRMPNDQEL